MTREKELSQEFTDPVAFLNDYAAPGQAIFAKWSSNDIDYETGFFVFEDRQHLNKLSKYPKFNLRSGLIIYTDVKVGLIPIMWRINYQYELLYETMLNVHQSGEYVHHIRLNENIKVGTCEDLYYTRMSQFKEALNAGLLEFVPGNLQPEKYLDIEKGFRFRFPFPDEDGREFGDYHNDYNRGVLIYLNDESKEILNFEHKESCTFFDLQKKNLSVFPEDYYSIEIVQQKQIEENGTVELWTVVRCPVCRNMARLDRESGFMLAENVLHNADRSTRFNQDFCTELAKRVRAGYKVVLHCEHCDKAMTENELKDLNDSTAGMAGDGSALCFGCAKKLGDKNTNWVRLGALKTEHYEGLK